MLSPALSGYAFDDRLALRAARHCVLDNVAFPFGTLCQGVPMAFPASPIAGAWGFPLWTLAMEVHCYGLVLAIGLAMAGRLTDTVVRRTVFLAAAAAAAAAFWTLCGTGMVRTGLFAGDFTLENAYTTYPVLFFIAGMALYGLRAFIVVDRLGALAAVTVAFACPFDPWLVYPSACYAVLALAADPALRRFHPPRDLSFGIYMYGAAMGQVAFAAVGPDRPWLHTAVTLPLTVLCAAASCIAVERPGLAAGRALSRGSRALAAGGRRLCRTAVRSILVPRDGGAAHGASTRGAVPEAAPTARRGGAAA